MASLRFTLGQTNLIAEGPLLVFSAGLGITGVSTANDFSVLALGVASQAAAPRLREESDISDKIDLNAVVTIGSNLCWSNTDQPAMQASSAGLSNVLLSLLLHGIITRPLGS